MKTRVSSGGGGCSDEVDAITAKLVEADGLSGNIFLSLRVMADAV